MRCRQVAQVAAANVIGTGVVLVPADIKAAFAEEIAVGAEPVEFLFRIAGDV